MQEQNQKAIDNALFKKLQQISIKINNDPSLYATDVQHYLELFTVQFNKVQGDTMKKNQRFGELLIFLARTVKHFPQKLGWIPKAVMKLMQELGPTLHHYLRKKCIGSIMILRAKNILIPVSTIQFLIRQMRIQDKGLRSMIYKYVLNDIRRMNKHHQNNKINQQIRAFISSYIPKHTDKTATKSLKLMVELYKRNIWTDNRTVNIIAEACFAPSSKNRLMASHFLMETTMNLDQLPDSDDDAPVRPSDIKARKGIIKQTKHKEKQLQKEKRKAARRLRKKEIEGRKQNFMPIDLLYNPQIFAEKLFNIMSGKSEKYQHKLVYMGLIARVIWRHQLILLPFYRSLIKYLEPKQKDVSQVLIALAESIHDLVPEDEIEAIIKHIIEHFVNDRCSEYTMTIGLNTLREVFKKMPSIITEEMMLYLATYYEYKNKNVSRAAKSLINFVKEYNPMLLEKKYRGNDRGGDDQEQQENKRHGPNDRINGASLLPNQGSIPIEMDRVLTDEDFRQIRRLMKKKEQEEERKNIRAAYQGEEEGQQDQEGDQEQEDEQGEEDSESDEEGEEESVLEWGDEEEIQVVDENQENAEGDEEQGQDQEDEQDQDESVIDWGDEQQVEMEDESSEKPNGKKAKDVKKKAKKSKEQVMVSEEDEDSFDDQSEQQQNPHGFIDPSQIAFYKMSKTELKAQKKTIKEGKQKFKHKPKEKKGGTTNREKQHLKPLMMVRAKKNKIRSNEKQLKLKIKSIKNQLGKVRSGKQAKKMKNKKIHKK